MHFNIKLILLPLKLFLSGALLAFTAVAQAQSVDTTSATAGLENLLSNDSKPAKEYVTATFKATKVINGQSNETLGAGVLDFIILHRFGRLNQGVSDFFGLDNANTRIAFDYGITNWLMIGVGRSSFEKEYDGSVKVKLLRQTTDNSMPITLDYAGSIMARTNKVALPDSVDYFFSNRMSYANQIIVARKFSNHLSLQITPSHVHYNLVKNASDPNDVFALGIGGRVKLSRRIAITGEWFYTLPGARLDGYRNSLSLGMDIETGGHVFQLHFSNSTGMTERSFIGQTTDDWAAGGIHFGFNLSRVFTIVRPKEFR